MLFWKSSNSNTASSMLCPMTGRSVEVRTKLFPCTLNCSQRSICSNRQCVRDAILGKDMRQWYRQCGALRNRQHNDAYFVEKEYRVRSIVFGATWYCGSSRGA